jgi:hypothetical protein
VTTALSCRKRTRRSDNCSRCASGDSVWLARWKARPRISLKGKISRCDTKKLIYTDPFNSFSGFTLARVFRQLASSGTALDCLGSIMLAAFSSELLRAHTGLLPTLSGQTGRRPALVDARREALR